MFWKKKKKAAPQPVKGKMSRDDIIAQAKANAAAARAEIGDDTLEKIRLAMMKKQNSPVEQAKARIKAIDQETVRSHLSLWLEEDKKK